MTGNAGGWTAIVLAGQRPGIDPLATAFGETYKAVIPVAGVPMLARVACTLLDCLQIGRIIVLGQEPNALIPILPNDPRLSVQQSSAGISASIEAVAGGPDAPWPVLVTSADHPLLTPQMVTEFIAGAQGSDVSIAMVEKATMDAAYPENRRTWRRFKGGAYSGANLFALQSDKARPALQLWAEAEADRKKQLGLLMHFGPLLALRAITRTITLEAGLAAAGRRLGLSAKPVILSQAEAAIDVDKLSDHVLVEAILNAREAA
jgi:GTP:adenosylcobinamide-phosphate guanylyltransferase